MRNKMTVYQGQVPVVTFSAPDHLSLKAYVNRLIQNGDKSVAILNNPGVRIEFHG